jgi:hypothetical protein
MPFAGPETTLAATIDHAVEVILHPREKRAS